MTSPSPRKTKPRSSMFTISLILGLLLIPLSAVAATALMSNDGETDGDDVGAIVVEVPETTVAREPILKPRADRKVSNSLNARRKGRSPISSRLLWMPSVRSVPEKVSNSRVHLPRLPSFAP